MPAATYVQPQWLSGEGGLYTRTAEDVTASMLQLQNDLLGDHWGKIINLETNFNLPLIILIAQNLK